jgi:hypothetical protein
LVANTSLVQFGTDIVASSGDIMTIIGNVLQIFMQPPIVFFLGIAVVATGVRIASKLIRRH